LHFSNRINPAIHNMTPERDTKFREVISKRQPNLTLILENIHDPHNISAILRSCDAVGIIEVFVINTQGPVKKKLGKKSSASARKWVEVNYFESVVECVEAVKNKGFSIWATHLSTDAISLYDLDLSKPAALAFGNEHAGVSEELLSYANGNFIIPMTGMIPSLNVSVACAVSLYEAFRQKNTLGQYDSASLSDVEMQEMHERWERK
jgi:tRNA (guanosine-2'-O-)-methyltransferase